MNNKKTNQCSFNIKSVFIILVSLVVLIFAFLNLNNILALLSKCVDVLQPIIIGLCLAYVVNPLYNFVIKKINKIVSSNEQLKSNKFFKGTSKVIAIVVCILVWIIIIAGFVFIVIPELYNSINKFVTSLPHYQSTALKVIESWDLVKYNDTIVNEALNYLNQIYEFLENFINGFFNNVIKNIYNGVVSTVSWIFNFFLGIIIMIYFLAKKDQLIYDGRRLVYSLLDAKKADKLFVELKYANEVFKKFFMGKILDSAIILALSYVIFSIMKFPYTTLLAVMIGVTNIVPFFGPIFGAIATAVLVFLVSPYQLLPFVLATFVIQQIDGNILGPKILGDQTGLDNFQVLCSTIIFGGLFGFVGMILAVPVWAIILRLINQSLVYNLKLKKLPTDASSYKTIPPKKTA